MMPLRPLPPCCCLLRKIMLRTVHSYCTHIHSLIHIIICSSQKVIIITT